MSSSIVVTTPSLLEAKSIARWIAREGISVSVDKAGREWGIYTAPDSLGRARVAFKKVIAANNPPGAYIVYAQETRTSKPIRVYGKFFSLADASTVANDLVDNRGAFKAAVLDFGTRATRFIAYGHRATRTVGKRVVVGNPCRKNSGGWYYGIKKGGGNEVFWSKTVPTKKSHGSRYLAVTGPRGSKEECIAEIRRHYSPPHTIKTRGKTVRVNPRSCKNLACRNPRHGHNAGKKRKFHFYARCRYIGTVTTTEAAVRREYPRSKIWAIGGRVDIYALPPKGKPKKHGHKNPMTAWDVYLSGKNIDTVFYSSDMTKMDVLTSLIRHDGYDPRIRLVKRKRKAGKNPLTRKEVAEIERSSNLYRDAGHKAHLKGLPEFGSRMYGMAARGKFIATDYAAKNNPLRALLGKSGAKKARRYS